MSASIPVMRSLSCKENQAYAECTSPNVDGLQDVPRSITQFLQDDIKRIEVKLQDSTSARQSWRPPRESVANSPPSPTRVVAPSLEGDALPAASSAASQLKADRPIDTARTRARQCSSVQKIIQSMTPEQATACKIPSNTMGLTSSRVFASSGSRNDGGRGPSSAAAEVTQGLISVKNLAAMPPRIVRTLVQVFVEKIHSLVTMVYEPTLWNQVRRVLRLIHDDGVTSIAPDYDFLIVHIVLAISASLGSASSGHGPQRMAFSESLFQDGIKHMSNPAVFPSEMSELESILLTLHYGTINPRCASVWMLSGSAMRLCLKLGLHRELEGQSTSADLAADMRRRLFWMSYCLDRHVCAALQYPISLSDAAINTGHFSILDDKCLPTDSALSGPVTLSKAPALHWLEYRQIHSDMVEVHFRGKYFGGSWEKWLAGMEAKLRTWYGKHSDTYPWTETAYHNALTYLHRPSPLTPKPTARSLLIAFENACAVASSYGKDIRAGYFRRPWLAAHHTFGSAVIVLFCLRHGSKFILTRFTPSEISDMTALFSRNLQSVSSEFWPEVSRCLEVYNRLLTPLIAAIMSDTDPGVAFGHEQDEELAHLLYPGTTRFEALSWDDAGGAQTTQDVDSALVNVDAFDWDLSRFDDFAWDETTFDFLDGYAYTPDWTEAFLVT
ncbi:hypothetical protein A1O3_06807 [Capronia epimyces CBS 606.96]|uniref:Xylanolytic transcriptional activator regulatory domain-containing protein n=1 Tax=Capronia epimyces CBS 606.96 TaxID=1182542 RepID=W9Y035_9EURO|nr:uncharacterized protein A1O3_06807 [Capronia epimyces CBS 606.96]EXJ82990.1 hypothetical protein A1O3_06807 [Capronia epimyces CBS 606.96]